MYRAFNAVRETKGGPFQTMEEAVFWSLMNLPILPELEETSRKRIESELAENGIVMISETQSKTVAEDVVIYDEERHVPDEEGYIDW